ncbi:MAG: choice-of-anchor X domain-containing protein [Bradymonadia bacterium]
MVFKYVKIAGLMGLVGASLSGCGLEGAVVEALGETNELPATRIRGSAANQPTAMTYTEPNGDLVEAVEGPDFNGASFYIALPSGSYTNGRLSAANGERVMTTLVPELFEESAIDGVVIDASTTTSTLITDAVLSAGGRTLQNVEPREVIEIFDQMAAAYGEEGREQAFLRMVERVLEAASTGGNIPVFNIPAFDAEFNATAPTLNPDWLAARQVDYDGDGAPDSDAAAFDAALGRVVESRLSEPVCYDPQLIQVVFEVDFNEGRLDGNCDSINRFRWVQDEPGKQMYFVGGVHEESELQDPIVDAILGNTGSWTPNTVPMYDDGTNGDEVAGDNIWTRAFALPIGMRMGYKYTWGQQGQLWTGSEEWPGNQHILEIVDVNGDNFVRRRDNFGDEATNKDLSNLGRDSGGMVTWDSDHNGDGIPDVHERPIDVDNDCTLDEWLTPTAVPPLTVPCEE